jgi:hypothetical protein
MTNLYTFPVDRIDRLHVSLSLNVICSFPPHPFLLPRGEKEGMRGGVRVKKWKG